MLPPTGRDRDVLLRAAVAAPSMHNTQPWKFRFDGCVIEVHRDRERELPAEDPDRRMLYLSLGAAVLNLRVGAAQLAYGTAVRCVLDRARPDLVAEVELIAGGAETEQLYRLASYLLVRRTNRQPYRELRLPAAVRRLLDSTAQLEGAELQWFDDGAKLKWLHLATADAGQADDHSAERSQERRLWVVGSRKVDGVPAASLGPRADRPESPARDMAATSLLNQAIEHDSLRWLLHDPLGAWSRPQAVIRFGYGPSVPRTPRRPLADVLLP